MRLDDATSTVASNDAERSTQPRRALSHCAVSGSAERCRATQELAIASRQKLAIAIPLQTAAIGSPIAI
jgi:hypothetical protein